eukprot:6310788-Pyramimonas_sp.AAC.1
MRLASSNGQLLRDPGVCVALALPDQRPVEPAALEVLGPAVPQVDDLQTPRPGQLHCLLVLDPGEGVR